MRLIILSFLLSITFFGCKESQDVYPKYSYSIGKSIPDSSKKSMIIWIQETIRATDQHLSAGDYEDPEDVILQVTWTAEKLFSRRVEGLSIKKYESDYNPEFVPEEKMTKYERDIYQKLKPRN